MSNSKRAATFHPGTGPTETTKSRAYTAALHWLKAIAYFGSQILAFDAKDRIERGVGKRARAYNASHPPPPGQRYGAAWVARRRQDIDE